MARWKNANMDGDAIRALKRDVLYREAAASFRKNGYHGTSLDEIAAKIGLSKATLYYYVKNKRDLLYRCHMAASDEAMSSVCVDQSLTAFERLYRTLKDYVRSCLAEGSYTVIILEEKSLSKSQLQEVIKRRDQFYDAILAIVAEAIEAKDIRPCNPKFAVLTFLGAVNWVTKWYRPDGDWPIDDISTSVAAFVCRGLQQGAVDPFPGSSLL